MRAEDAAGVPLLRTRRADLHGRTPNQTLYLKHIQEHDITFGIGPAGTGKTYLAMALAVDALIERILGEALGASRVGYGTIDHDAGTITVERNWFAPGFDDLPGVILRTPA